MKITNYEDTGLMELNEFLKESTSNRYNFDKATIKELLKPYNVAFCLEKINRLQSMLICELGDSYVQQSQRYVEVVEESYYVPKLNKEDKKIYIYLANKGFELYKKMSELENGNYKHNIPIEDARYVLPLNTYTNISIAMNASKLYDMFELFNNNVLQAAFKDIKEALLELIPDELRILLKNVTYGKSSAFIEIYYKKLFDKISPENPVIELNRFQNQEIRIGFGSLTSTQSKTTSELMNELGDEIVEKAHELTQKVIEDGHVGVTEQARYTYGLMFSLCSYHQQIRYRLPINHRETIADILRDNNRKFYIPASIEKSIFKDEYIDYINEVKSFRNYLFNNYNVSTAALFLLNCDSIKQISSTNARIDCDIIKSILSPAAQWEIKEVYQKKLDILSSQSPTIYNHSKTD